jgi:hypothetical protein
MMMMLFQNPKLINTRLVPLDLRMSDRLCGQGKEKVRTVAFFLNY